MHFENEAFQGSTGTLCELRDFDSVSMRSGLSSVVDSEFVASQIKRFEARCHVQAPTEQSSNQINLQISVISPQIPERSHSMYSDNGKGVLITEKSSSNDNFLRKPMVWICLATLTICIIVGSIIGVVLSMKDREKTPISDEANETTSLTPTTTSSSTTTTTTTSTAEPTTEESYVNHEPFNFFNRSEWKALPMKGKTSLKLPVTRLILMDTQTETCQNVDDCKLFMAKRQNASYLSYAGGTLIHDVPENFLIATDGSMFEGRGLSYEGQHTMGAGTSYNNDAVGISFIGSYKTNDLSSAQKESLDYFIQKFVENGNVKSNYLVYYKDQLIKSTVIDDLLYEHVKTFKNWKESPKIIRRSEWQAVPRSGVSEFLRKFSTDAVISHSGNSSCFELNDCIDQLKQRQEVERPENGDIQHGFIFGGNDYIFEGRSFDITDSPLSGLELLFLGDFMTASPPLSLMNKLEDFLRYSVDIGKLTEDYKILGEKKVVYTTSPGDKLYEIIQKAPFELHFDFNEPEAGPCWIGCG